MKIQVFSDLHLEFYKSFRELPIQIEPLCDILILAGDIGFINDDSYKEFIDYIHNKWKYIFIVLGNHEYYSKKNTYIKLKQKYKEFFKSYDNIHLLDKKVFEFTYNENGIEKEWIIIGCTLWAFISDINFEKISCSKYIQYYNTKKERKLPITLNMFNDMHHDEKNWLIETYDTTIKKNIIIVTHYPVINHYFTNNKHYPDNTNDNGFYNNLKLKNKRIENNEESENNVICISGHTHYSFNKKINNIRYISNQMGYDIEYENKITKFNHNGLFEV